MDEQEGVRETLASCTQDTVDNKHVVGAEHAMGEMDIGGARDTAYYKVTGNAPGASCEMLPGVGKKPHETPRANWGRAKTSRAIGMPRVVTLHAEMPTWGTLRHWAPRCRPGTSCDTNRGRSKTPAQDEAMVEGTRDFGPDAGRRRAVAEMLAGGAP